MQGTCQTAIVLKLVNSQRKLTEGVEKVESVEVETLFEVSKLLAGSERESAPIRRTAWRRYPTSSFEK